MKWMTTLHSPSLALLMTLLASGGAVADTLQPTSKLSTDKEAPWARGISPSQQETALQHLLSGNRLLQEEIALPEAIQEYREALKVWDHPAIHYNLVLALMNIDQPVEAHQHVLKAMEHGPDALDEQKYKHALHYKSLLEKQLTRVLLICEGRCVAMTLDGQVQLSAPGRRELLVRPGTHQFVASGTGYLPTSHSRELHGGERLSISLNLYSDDELVVRQRLWPEWRPWAVVGAGAAVALVGAFFHRQAYDNYRAFDASIQGMEQCAQGCRPPAEVNASRGRGDTLQRAAFGGYAFGGALMATGALLLHLNYLQEHRITPEQKEGSVIISPLVEGHVKGATATFNF